MSIEYLESAFPLDNDRGMTLRDWFAGQALAGIMATSESRTSASYMSPASWAEAAYVFADAMLAERAKP